ncbi:unnamed protein product [Vitrella brassicaformis CCMP3155]|uniref:Uncharacterized protein n=1 Tax=Vitrella brassicaformis (strain CCMP3155) TaxID=1169540 RepID=A0A0G4FCR1_VITBC|nr:unnamed protein product [Vitrella brassicaformis CCMP3155]|eukprot:CEM11027.1 unnamed protein product [Vitrella brassicaformis CCMP3155]
MMRWVRSFSTRGSRCPCSSTAERAANDQAAEEAAEEEGDVVERELCEAAPVAPASPSPSSVTADQGGASDGSSPLMPVLCPTSPPQQQCSTKRPAVVDEVNRSGSDEEDTAVAETDDLEAPAEMSAQAKAALSGFEPDPYARSIGERFTIVRGKLKDNTSRPVMLRGVTFVGFRADSGQQAVVDRLTRKLRKEARIMEAINGRSGGRGVVPRLVAWGDTVWQQWKTTEKQRRTEVTVARKRVVVALEGTFIMMEAIDFVDGQTADALEQRLHADRRDPDTYYASLLFEGRTALELFRQRGPGS